jgi:hypothetical protein
VLIHVFLKSFFISSFFDMDPVKNNGGRTPLGDLTNITNGGKY